MAQLGGTSKGSATIEDLYHVPENGKAEIVDGELVLMSPTGFLPSRAGLAISMSLKQYERRTRRGFVLPDNAGFIVDLPRRKSFSPDAAFYVGEPTRGKFVRGAPLFAAEVRSEDEYGPAAERKMAAKRADYFAAGTEVVWDVDVLREELVGVYTRASPDVPRLYRRGEQAEAGPALPGWTMPVEELFE
jgi:Uma2 family endonuclease